MDIELCETALTGQKLWELLKKSEQIEVNGHEIQEVEAAVVGVGQGFTSKVLRVQLKWSQSADQLPKSVIVKVIGSKAWEIFMVDAPGKTKEEFKRALFEAHNIECKIYALKGLREVVKMPACYATVLSVGDEAGIIVLEDLGDRGIVLPMTSMGVGFTLGQLDSVLEALATTHAWSVNNTEWRKDIISLKEFNVLEPLMQNFLGKFSQSKALYPEIFKNLDEAKFSEFVSSERFVEIFGDDPKVRYNLPLVLVHGDVHTVNMMFEKTAENKAGDILVALLDWQMAHQGCAMEDITRLILVCAPIEVRRGEKMDDILKKYVQLFNSKVKNIADHITYEDVKRAFNEMFSFYAVMWTCGVGMIDQFAGSLKFENEADKELFKDQMLKNTISCFQQACNILNW